MIEVSLDDRRRYIYPVAAFNRDYDLFINGEGRGSGDISYDGYHRYALGPEDWEMYEDGS